MSREHESTEKQDTLRSLKVKLYASQALLALQQNRTFDIKVVNSSVAWHKQVSNQQKANTKETEHGLNYYYYILIY